MLTLRLLLLIAKSTLRRCVNMLDRYKDQIIANYKQAEINDDDYISVEEILAKPRVYSIVVYPYANKVVVNGRSMTKDRFISEILD